jgi:hypothetical protein
MKHGVLQIAHLHSYHVYLGNCSQTLFGLLSYLDYHCSLYLGVGIRHVPLLAFRYSVGFVADLDPTNGFRTFSPNKIVFHFGFFCFLLPHLEEYCRLRSPSERLMEQSVQIRI